jgi:small conductance mechanosensitive channel
MLLLFRPLRVGDHIEAAGTAGTVARCAHPTTCRFSFQTRVSGGDTIKNYAANDMRRNDITVGIAYDDDIGKAIEIVRGVLDAETRVRGLSIPFPQRDVHLVTSMAAKTARLPQLLPAFAF